MAERAGAPSGALLAAGRVGRPHGLDGSFHVIRPRARLLRLGARVVVDGAQREIVRRAGTEDRPILRLTGVASREAIEALRGVELQVPRDDAPPLEPGEYLAEDLEGCRVTDGDRQLGVVARMLPYPSCELLEVRRPGRPDLLVPFIADAVRAVDVAAGRIDVDATFLGATD